MKIVISAIMVEAMIPIRHAVRPPTEVEFTGPSMARNAGLLVIELANAARSASFGYSVSIAENVDAATALNPTIQISSGIRSRRRLSPINARDRPIPRACAAEPA